MAVVSYLASAILVLRKGDPFSAGGENYIITAQNIFIVLLLFVFAKPAMSTLRAVPLETFLDAGRWGGAEGCPYVRGWNAETWKKTEAE